MSETTQQDNVTPAAPEVVQPEVVAAAAPEVVPEVVIEEISYHAVEKNGTITAIWEMRGRKHLRTIDPRSAEGRHLLGTPESPASSEAAAG